jgi:YVTN family beta-propeller protein
MSPKTSRKHSRINPLHLIAGLLATGLSVPALLGQSAQFPTYTVGPQTNGTYVVSDGTIITPVGTQVDLGIRVRAKAIALNPTGNHTAAVLTMGTSPSNGNGAVEVFNTQTGKVLQSYNFKGTDSSGSITGITYTPNGKYLVFSQDSSNVTIAIVNPTTGWLSDDVQVSVPVDGSTIALFSTVAVPGVGFTNVLNTVTCAPSQAVTFPVTGQVLPGPVGNTGSFALPCGWTYSFGTSYPTGVAISPDNKTAYAVLDVNNTLAKIDLTATTPTQGPRIRVGNVPHSIVISPDGKTAYVTNEAGRIATANDFQLYSDGTPVVAENPTGTTATGTVSVVDLASFTVTGSISTGHHPTGMAFWGKYLLVANAYSDSLSVIDTTSNTVAYTINLGLPISVPGEKNSAYGAGPNSIAVDEKNNVAYVAFYNANAVAVVDLRYGEWNPVMGMIPVGYAPSSVALDAADNALLVANDKGIGSKGIPPQNSFKTEFGVTSYNTYQDLGTVSIVPVPKSGELATMTQQVFQNNHWDLKENIESAGGGNPHAGPIVIPEKIGDPSLIKHVFLIIRENRTYDQMLGDVAAGNGDASLAVFGDNATFGSVSPNAHALVERFPLFDNFYDPARQSADGHNWILQAMAPYGDDIQSPDWVRDYPYNGGDPIAYQKKGHLFDVAAKARIKMKIYGEYIEENTFKVPGCNPATLTPPLNYITIACEPAWSQFYADTQKYESGLEPQLQYYNAVGSYSPLPNLMKYAIQNYPQFDLNIPDQYRVDIWKQDFAKDVAAGSVPQLSILSTSSDHTGNTNPGLTPQAMQADNDLAVGRFVDIISHSNVWDSSAIFIEEDDAQTGVDHVDGHRSPGYIISPYVRQDGFVDSHYYSQVNLTRTIEQILGLTPMNQNDLVASPMKTAFIDEPPAENFKPWTHVENGIPLDQTETSVAFTSNSPAVKALRAAWLKKKAQIFAGRQTKPDSEDPDTVKHLIWYEATGFTRPYPGEKKVRPASDFNRKAPAASADLDD